MKTLLRAAGDVPTEIRHTFSTHGHYRGALLSSLFCARHNELEHTKLLDHKLDVPREQHTIEQLTWLKGNNTLTGNATTPSNQ